MEAQAKKKSAKLPACIISIFFSDVLLYSDWGKNKMIFKTEGHRCDYFLKL